MALDPCPDSWERELEPLKTVMERSGHGMGDLGPIRVVIPKAR
jgi:hypothetical protein